MLCMTLGHRINKMKGDVGRSRVLLEKFYSYRGIAISSLNDSLDVEHKRTENSVIAGILTFLLVDVS